MLLESFAMNAKVWYRIDGEVGETVVRWRGGGGKWYKPR